MDILKRIEKFKIEEQPRLNKLYRYYIGKNDILNTTKEAGKPNNKLSHNYAKSIVNNSVGYFMGKPVTYTSCDENLNIKIQEIIKQNDDVKHNTAIATDLSIYGKAFELLYVDYLKNVRYTRLDPKSVIVKYKNDVEKNIEYAIYFFSVYDEEKEEFENYVNFYNSVEIVEYVEINGNLAEINRTQHYFGSVPIVVYSNNSDEVGDFENVVSLIDAYDTMQSESLNDFQLFADAYLHISGMQLDEEEAKTIRENRIISGDGVAEWLTKNVNDTYIENIKNRLDKDIYKFSNTVNMSDENFANNLSGIAIKYKLLNMENRIAVTENFFKQGLQQRFKLICYYLYILGSNYDYTTITYTFTRNIPINLSDMATIGQQLSGLVSTETILSLLPFISDVKAEMEKIQAEAGEYTNFEEIEDGE